MPFPSASRLTTPGAAQGGLIPEAAEASVATARAFFSGADDGQQALSGANENVHARMRIDDRRLEQAEIMRHGDPDIVVISYSHWALKRCGRRHPKCAPPTLPFTWQGPEDSRLQVASHLLCVRRYEEESRIHNITVNETLSADFIADYVEKLSMLANTTQRLFPKSQVVVRSASPIRTGCDSGFDRFRPWGHRHWVAALNGAARVAAAQSSVEFIDVWTMAEPFQPIALTSDDIHFHSWCVRVRGVS